MTPFQLTHETRAGALIVRAAGKFDRDAGVAVEGLLGDGPAPYVLNLSEVEYISSSGIAYLVKLSFARGLRLASPPAGVRQALGLAGIEQILSIHPDEATACNADS